MNFLYPSFLFGLFAVAVPVIVHLFDLRRHKKVIFTNVRFLKVVKETQTSRRKLYRLLILACRILFIVFLTAAFAQPYIGGALKDSSLSREVRIYIDNSPSMADRLGYTVTAAENLVRSYPASIGFRYFNNDFSEGTEALSRDEIIHKLRNTQTSHAFRTVRELKDRQDAGIDPKTACFTYWFSDFQKSAFSDINSLRVREEDRLYLLPASEKSDENVFIDSVWTDTPVPGKNVNHVLYVRTANAGKEIAEVSVSPVVDEAQIGAKIIQIKPGGKIELAFPFRLSDSGYHQGKVSVNDETSFDNEYFFVLKATSSVTVEIVSPKNGYVLQAFKTDPFFRVNSSNRFDISAENPPNLLVADGVAVFTPENINDIKEFVAAGGSFFLFPAPNPDMSSYNRLASALGLPSFRSVGRPAGGETNADELAAPDPRDSFFAGIFERKIDKDVKMPFAIPVLDYDRGMGRSLIQRKNRSVFLSSFESGKGTVYVCSTPQVQGYTNFFDHPLIVPVLYKAAFRSVRSEEKAAHLLNGAPVKIEAEGAEEDRAFSLVGDSLNIIPRQSFNKGILTFDVPGSDLDPGWYELRYKDQTAAVVAFNTDRRESYLASYSLEELRDMFRNRKNIFVEENARSENLSVRAEVESVPVKLWKYCLIFALIFLLLETFFVRRLKNLSAA